MKKLLLAMLLVVTVLLGGCFGDKTEEKASNESILAALQQLGQTTKKADAANGVKAGVYYSIGGKYVYYSFEDLALMSAGEKSIYFNRMNDASMADSYVVNNEKAITFTQVNEAVMAGNSLATILETSGAAVDATFAIQPSTKVTVGLTAEEVRANGDFAGELDITSVAAVENGKITLNMNQTPAVVLTGANFTVTQTVTTTGTSSPAAVAATNVTVSSTTEQEVVLTVDVVDASYYDVQTLSYTVTYSTGVAITTADVTVDKKAGTSLAQLSVRADSLYVEFAAVQDEAIVWDVTIDGTAIDATDVRQNDRFFTIYLDESLSDKTGTVVLTGTIGSTGNYIVPVTKNYNFTGTGEYELVINVKNPTSYVTYEDVEEPAINAGGAETVQIQAYFIDSGSQSINTAVAGKVTFSMSIAGELSQEEITFDDGIAITTLSSEALTSNTRAQINVIADVTGTTHANLDGKSTTAPIWFLTGEAGDGTIEKITYATYNLKSADAYQADRLYITFDAPLVKRDATGAATNEYIDVETVLAGNLTIKEAYPEDKAVGDAVEILDVVRIGAATYLVILDTDTDRTWNAGADNCILKDNSAYEVEITTEVAKKTAATGNYVIAAGTVQFRFTDITPLDYLSANMVELDGTDSAKKFQLVFNEAVAYDWTNAGNVAPAPGVETSFAPDVASAPNNSPKWFVNTVSNITVNGYELNVTPGSDYEVEAIEVGKWESTNDSMVLTTAADIEKFDSRNVVTVTLADDAAKHIFNLETQNYSQGTISVSVANVRDWAIYDVANTVAQQVKQVDYDIQMANIAIEEVVIDSTEQFLVKFANPVEISDSTKTLRQILTMHYGVDLAGSGDEDTQEYTMNDTYYKMTVLTGENGEDTGYNVDNPGEAGEVQYVLFELNRDWNEDNGPGIILPNETVLYSNNEYKNIQFRVAAETMKVAGQFWENLTEVKSDVKTLMLDNSSPHVKHLDAEVAADSTISNEYYIDSAKAPSEEALDTYVVQHAAEADAKVTNGNAVTYQDNLTTFGAGMNYDAAYDKQDIVFITFNEPIQVLDGAGLGLVDPITYVLTDLNTETEYQANVNGTLVRVPAKYIAVNERDTTVVAVPNFALVTGAYVGADQLQDIFVGDWDFVIKNIDDDAGHNLNSDIQVINIKADAGTIVNPDTPDGAVDTGVYVAWARYIDDIDANTSGDDYFTNNTILAGQDPAKISVIEVKYSTEMKAGIPEGVNEASNYFVNGKALPVDNTIVFKGIYGVTDSWDGVTIVVNNNAVANPWLDANEDDLINEYIQMNFSKEIMGESGGTLSSTEIDLRMDYDAGTNNSTGEVTDVNVAEWVCKKLRAEGAKVYNAADADPLGSLKNNYVAYTTEDLLTLGLTNVITGVGPAAVITDVTLPTYDFYDSVTNHLGGTTNAGDHLYTIELWDKARTTMVTQLSGTELVPGGDDHTLSVATGVSDDYLDFVISETNSRLRVYFDDCLIYNMDIDEFYDRAKAGAITNVADLAAVEIEFNGDVTAVLPGNVEVTYADASTAMLAIVWDTASFDNQAIGTVTVRGIVTNPNTAAEVAVTIDVTVTADTTAPVITLNGNPTVYLTVGAIYVEAGATAEDAVDGTVDVVLPTTAGIDTTTDGSFTLTYSAVDAAGNQAEATRTVVVDGTAPVITLEGEATVTLTVGDTYTEAGVKANEVIRPINKVGEVDTTTAGTYTITYTAIDMAGNVSAPISRTVVVNPVAGTLVNINVVNNGQVTFFGKTVYNYSLSFTVDATVASLEVYTGTEATGTFLNLNETNNFSTSSYNVPTADDQVITVVALDTAGTILATTNFNLQ